MAKTEKVYVLSQHGLKYSLSGYFSKDKEDLDAALNGWSYPPGWKLVEATLEFKDS